MRIIAGSLGGRIFNSPKSHRTHPMADKVRGALFNILGDLKDLTLLDAFAGSGAVSFEAISRGAKYVTAIDSDKIAQKIIADNIASLGLQSKVKLIKASANAWLKTTNESFDIVVCDPPYDEPQLKLIENLAGRVKPNGILALSLPPKLQFSLNPNYELLADKNYGDAQLVFYRRIS